MSHLSRELVATLQIKTAQTATLQPRGIAILHKGQSRSKYSVTLSCPETYNPTKIRKTQKTKPETPKSSRRGCEL